MPSGVKTNELVVRGVVMNAMDGRGVHGISVRLKAPKRLLANSDRETLSHADGAFELRLDPQAVAKRVRPSPVLQFFDRDGQLLHVQGIPANSFSLRATPLRVMLPEAKLAAHLGRLLSIERRSGRLVQQSRLAILTHALSRLQNLDSARYTNLLSERSCPFPPLDHFEDLLDDVWGTLDGNPAAQARLEDMLELFSADSVGREPAPSSASLPARPNLSVQGDLDHLIGEIKVSASMWAPIEALLGRDAVIPLLLATAVVAGEARLVPMMRAMLGQMAAYRPLTVLLSAAEQSLGGGEQGERHLLAILETIDELCSFKDGLPPPFEGPPFDPSGWPKIEHWGCTAETALAVSFIRDRLGFPPRPRPSTARYRIDAIEPAHVCSGDEIVLRGVGFTETPGLVRFSGGRERRGMPIDVEATSWTDTEIVVTIPMEAACGSIELRIPEERITVSACDVFHDFSTYRTAEREFLFDGCRPRIAWLGITTGTRCATVGASTAITWSVEPEFAETSLTIREGSGEDMPIETGGTASGSLILDTSHIATYTFQLTATNPESECGIVTESLTVTIVPPSPVLSIVGVELTQGIQRFSLTDPTVANNSVGMIANMDTIVRVFVASDRGPGFAPDARVSGRLYCAGGIYRPINGNPRGTMPIITVGATPLRSNVNDSLNFLIPAARARGGFSMAIEVFSIDVCNTDATATTTMPIEWVRREPYPVTVRRITEPGTGDGLLDDEALELILQAFDRLPSPRSEIRLRPGVFAIHEGTTEANYCTDGGYYQLALSVAYEHNGVEGVWPDPHETAWIGLYSRFGCSAGGMMSWPWTSTCISEPDAESAAHELAHTTGMGHTVTSAGERCEDIAQPVACHHLPNDGILQDVVFDIRNNVVIVGAADLMSYRPEFGFPHPDHWERIRNNMDGRF
jgi:hypothetical protein